jgi:hypothetical protein
MDPPVRVDFSYSTPVSGSYTHASSSPMFCSSSFSGRLRTPTTTLDGLLADLERSMAASAVLRASSTSPLLPGGDAAEPAITEPSRFSTNDPDGEVSSPVGENDAMCASCGRPPDPPLPPPPPPPLCAVPNEYADADGRSMAPGDDSGSAGTSGGPPPAAPPPELTPRL